MAFYADSPLLGYPSFKSMIYSNIDVLSENSDKRMDALRIAGYSSNNSTLKNIVYDFEINYSLIDLKLQAYSFAKSASGISGIHWIKTLDCKVQQQLIKLMDIYIYSYIKSVVLGLGNTDDTFTPIKSYMFIGHAYNYVLLKQIVMSNNYGNSNIVRKLDISEDYLENKIIEFKKDFPRITNGNLFKTVKGWNFYSPELERALGNIKELANDNSEKTKIKFINIVDGNEISIIDGSILDNQTNPLGNMCYYNEKNEKVLLYVHSNNMLINESSYCLNRALFITLASFKSYNKFLTYRCIYNVLRFDNDNYHTLLEYDVQAITNLIGVGCTFESYALDFNFTDPYSKQDIILNNPTAN